jgi:hypothetical protein
LFSGERPENKKPLAYGHFYQIYTISNLSACGHTQAGHMTIKACAASVFYPFCPLSRKDKISFLCVLCVFAVNYYLLIKNTIEVEQLIQTGNDRY